MVLDVARFWERGGHPIDLGNRGLCTTLWESINKFIVKKITLLQTPPKTIGCKAPFKLRDAHTEEKRSAYIRKFFDRSHYEKNFNDLLSMINTRP